MQEHKPHASLGPGGPSVLWRSRAYISLPMAFLVEVMTLQDVHLCYNSATLISLKRVFLETVHTWFCDPNRDVVPLPFFFQTQNPSQKSFWLLENPACFVVVRSIPPLIYRLKKGTYRDPEKKFLLMLKWISGRQLHVLMHIWDEIDFSNLSLGVGVGLDQVFYELLRIAINTEIMKSCIRI